MKKNNCFIPVSAPSIGSKEIRYALNAIKSGWVSSLGSYIDEFEKKFAEYIGTKYALTVANGTVALHLILACLGINESDEIIVPDFTFVATANAVAYTGANPVFVDIDLDTWCINVETVKRAITSRTKAIIPVHLYGHPAEMDMINKIAREHDLFVIEDAAEAHGAEYKGKRVGGLGDAGVFSFYGNKIITTGEGGMITTNNRKIYEKAKYLRDHAMSKKKRYWHTEIGYNYRMTNIQAALGVAQLERIDELINKKIQIYEWYKKYLGDIDGIQLNPCKENVKNVFWMICMVIDDGLKVSRGKLMNKLKEKGIDTRPFFYPISQMPMYENKNRNRIADDISRRGINLPSGVGLEEEDVRRISKMIIEITKKRK